MITNQSDSIFVLAARSVGRGVFSAAKHSGRITLFMIELAKGLVEWKVWLKPSIDQAVKVGYGSLFIIIVTASFAGAVTALQAGYQLTAGVPVYFASGVVVSTIILELGPVLTALILSGRVGARYAAELGTMRVTEQIDAMESLGRSSVSYILLPRIIAVVIMVPVLVAVSNCVAILAGWFGLQSSMGMSYYDFTYGARFFFQPFYISYSIEKSIMFGLAIAVVPCYVGYYTEHGAEGVGKSTTGAVVSASVLILVLNAVLAKVLLP